MGMEASERDLSGTVIALHGIPPHPLHMAGMIPPNALKELQQATEGTAPVHVQISLHMENGKLRVEGRVTGVVSLICPRCLNRFEQPLLAEVEREYVAGKDPANLTRESEMVDDIVHLADGIFSVKRMAEEEMILALPMIPLCRDDCRGLCTVCGADLSRNPCSCAPPPDDGPFAALKKLKGG
ncbi:MAG: DUF177 domain-containing protein [Magnetococcales bacterium]|nr:DUF177 domain-containing protein [Magnetococcales bacterium]